jgi:hypothetical protein
MLRIIATAITAALLATLLPGLVAGAEAVRITDACPADQVTDSGFADTDRAAVHKAGIDCMAWWGIARGRDAERYDPLSHVTRAQMGSFIARLIRTPGGRLPATPADHFTDDRGSVHHYAINRLAQVGVVAGRGGGLYAPDAPVTREQMASFLVNAYEQRTGRSLPAGSGDAFADIGASFHRENINKVARAGIAQGTEPGRYEPSALVTRAQMASFLARALQAVAEDGEITDSPATLRAASDLRDYEQCDDLLGDIKEQALEQVGPFGLEGGFRGGFPGIGGPEDDTADEAPTADPAPAQPRAGEDFSDTNVQEEGVDEADIVKTDGQRILAISGATLRWIDVTADSPRQEASLSLGEGWGGELLVHGDRALVQRVEWRWPEGPITVLSILDVSAPSALRELDRLTIEGQLLSSRMVDGVARVVLRADPMPDFVYPQVGTEEDVRETERRNREIVEQSAITDWLPGYTLDSGGEGSAVGCLDVARPPEFSGLGTLSVVTVDVAGGRFIPDTAASVLAAGETVYASRTGLYVATSRWDAWGSDGAPVDDMTAEVHAFDITDPQRAVYRASGKVPGWILNQFSLSEHEGHLRVASTRQPSWWWTGEGDPSESFLTVLAPQGDRLVQVGQVGGLGLDERIYAVRYMGDTAYVVTFRETDPLYVIDLSDPTSPTVRGELKITGFSAYLHPVADGLLLGVGQDATEEGWQLGTQLSLFDVSDPADPQRRFQTTVEGGHSEVEYDHRAFLYWPHTGLVMLPVTRWSWDEDTGQSDSFTGAIGWDLDLQAGFTEIGRVSHPQTDYSGDDEFADEPFGGGSPMIRRSLVIGDAVYTLSGAGLMESSLTTLSERTWIPFE